MVDDSNDLTQLQQRAMKAILAGTEWLSEDQVGCDAARRWRESGQVFAIRQADELRFPRYAFDDNDQPLTLIAEIIKILAGYSESRIASWMESGSSYLSGRRPRECLRTEPAAVLAAARAHSTGPVHG